MRDYNDQRMGEGKGSRPHGLSGVGCSKMTVLRPEEPGKQPCLKTKETANKPTAEIKQNHKRMLN